MIADKLKLNEREKALLITGSVSPDNWEDFPHHHGKESEITRNIINSRILFLKHDDEYAHCLGVALHYLQDRWTLSPRIKDKHTPYEYQ